MKELSLNILDIAQNSLSAKCKNLSILLDETSEALRITITDDGCGMDSETAKSVTNPFYTTRKTRKVGLGIPLFKLAAEQTGGSLTLKSVPASESSTNHGTVISGLFYKSSIDFTPLGDIASTVMTLINGLSDDVNLIFKHRFENGMVHLETSAFKEQLGDIPLNVPEVSAWIAEYLKEQYETIENKN